MQTVTPRFLAALRDSHEVTVRAILYAPGDTTGVEANVIGGQIRADRDARVTRQGTVQVTFSLAQAGDTARLLPFGGYCRLERGIKYADGTRELIPVGHLRIDSLNWSGEEGAATLTVSDRMAQIQDEPFTVPWAPTGLKPSDAISQAVYDVFADTIGYQILTTPATEPAIPEAIYDQDRAQAIGDLASSVSAEAHFSPAGDFVLAPRPDLDALTAVWTVDAGEEGSLEEVQENLDRTTVRNGIAVRGQAAPDLPPVFALAVDDTPGSPTLWGGPFGRVALVSSLTSVVDQAQANATAASLLNLRLGLARSLTLQTLPNPALEPGDAVTVVFSDGRTDKQLVNAVELELGPEGSFRLVTTSQWRPDALKVRRVRVFSGLAAWRELRRAHVPA